MQNLQAGDGGTKCRTKEDGREEETSGGPTTLDFPQIEQNATRVIQRSAGKESG